MTDISCPSCGARNAAGSRFCAHCGTSLSSSSSGTGPAPDYGATSSEYQRDVPPTDPEWRMSDPGPLPEPKRRRRTLLWIVGAILGVCLIACCAAGVWINTESGQETLSDFATRAVELSTEQAQ